MVDETTHDINVIDVRSSKGEFGTAVDLRHAIVASLSHHQVSFTDSRLASNGNNPTTTMLRSIPTMVLYNDRGLELFDQITYTQDYYLTNAEIDIFHNHADELVETYVQEDSALIELGCGSMRKTKYVLESVTRANKSVTYYAVDLSEVSLRESLTPLVRAFPRIKFVGLWGTYDDALNWLHQQLPKSIHKMYLWLGSSIGNFTREEGTAFLKRVSEQAMYEGDVFVCGMDRRNRPEQVSLAYNDREGLTRSFILNGLTHCNHIFGQNLFDVAKFEYVSIYNDKEGRHEAYYQVLTPHSIQLLDTLISLEKDDLINVEYSHKYSQEEIQVMAEAACFVVSCSWSDSRNQYDVHVFGKKEQSLRIVA